MGAAMTPGEVVDEICTCRKAPLGLDVTITAGCLIHDSCACGTAECEESPCLWCVNYLEALTELARHRRGRR